MWASYKHYWGKKMPSTRTPAKAFRKYLLVLIGNAKGGTWSRHYAYLHNIQDRLRWRSLTQIKKSKWVSWYEKSRHLSTIPEGVKHGKRNTKSRKAPVSPMSRVNSSEAETTNDYKSKDSLRGSHNSVEPKVLKQVSDRFSTTLEYITYCSVERSSFYDNEVAKHMLKWASRWQVQMKVQASDPMDPYRQ